MKRSLRWLCWITLFSFFLPACAGLNPAGTALAKPTTIVFVVQEELRDFYEARAKDFKTKEPNITIDIKSYQAAGSVRDLTLVRFAGDPSRTLQAMESALDLSPFVQEDQAFNRADFFPGTLEAFSRSGKLVGIPLSLDPFVLFYNQGIFDQAGIPYPTSGMRWDEFKTLAMRLRDPEKNIYGYAPFGDYTDSIFFAFQHGATLFNGDQVRLDSREAIEAVEWYATLFSDTGAAPSLEKLKELYGNSDIYPGIMQGQIAMWMWPLSTLQVFSNPQNTLKIGVVSLPHDITAFSVSQIDGVVISTDTKSPEACWRWANYLSRQAASWAVPARKSVATSADFTTSMGKERATAAITAIQEAQLISNYDMAAMQKVIEPFLRAVTRTVDGMIPASETLADAQKEATR